MGGESRRLATILAIDIAGFSRASERDEIAAARAVSGLRERCAAAAAERHGRIFNTAGDGVMMEFPTVAAGVAAALDIDEGLRGEGAPRVRMGLHLGDVTVLANGDLIGAGVNVAARVQQRAEPGQILATGDVRNLVSSEGAAQFTALGSAQLEKMQRHVALFALSRPGVAVRRTLIGRWKMMRPWIRSAAGIVLGLAVGAGLYVLMKPAALTTPSAVAQPQSNAPVIAVLPFDNLSADPGLDYFSDGITEEIQSALSRIPGLRVISRASSFAVGGAEKDARAAAAALNATHVLTGSVRRNGGAMRVSAQLLLGRTGEILWNETFERPVSETLAVQDEIANRVARALRVVVPESARAQPIDPRAFELYLRGREAWRSGGDGQRPPDAAIADLEEAVRIAPDFARAWAALASAYAQRQNWLTGPAQDEAIAKAIAAATRARDLDPSIGEPYIVLGRLDPSSDYEARGKLFAQALAAGPNDDEVLMLYARFWLMEIGRMDEASQMLARAFETDPYSELLTSTYVEALGHSGDAAGIEKVIEQRKAEWPEVESFWSFIVSIHLASRDFPAARAALAKLNVFLDAAAAKFPEKDLKRVKGAINDVVTALESGDKALVDKVAGDAREQLSHGQAEAQQALHLLAWLGLGDEAMEAAQELYVKRGFAADRSPAFAIPTRFPYGRPITAPLLSHDGLIVQRDRRIWSIFAAIGLAKYWADSDQWPDFCADPSLGYDCREEAGKALEALKIN